MLEDALAYPRRDDDWLTTVLIGGVLSLASFLVLPIFLVQGYYLRVLAGEGEEPPTFSDWEELFVDGLKAFVVMFVYGVVPMLAGFVVPAVVGTFVLGMGSAAGSNGAGMAGLGIFAGLLALVLVPLLFLAIFAAVYLGPAGLALLAREGRIGAAFDWGRLKAVAFTKEYAVGWLLAAVVLVVGGMVASVLMIVLVGFFLSFYVNVVAYRVIGEAVGDALGADATSGNA